MTLADRLLKATDGAAILAALHGYLRFPGDPPSEADLAEALPHLDAPLAPANERLRAVMGREDWHWIATTRDNATALAAIRVPPAPAAFEIIDLPAVHEAWRDLPPGERPKHPAAPLVEAWQSRPRAVEPFRPAMRASLPRFHFLDGDAARLPGFAASNAPPPPDQLALPGFEPPLVDCPSWLLWLYDRAGGESLAQGRGAAWDLHLFVSAFLHLPVAARTGDWRKLTFPVTEAVARDWPDPAAPSIESWLHPDGWANYRRDWRRLPEALHRMASNLAYVPIPGVGSVAMVFPSAIPETREHRFVEFTLRVPRAAAAGASVDWQRLRRYRLESAALYRAYLSAAALQDRTAHRGRAITAELGVPLLDRAGKTRRRKGGRVMRSKSERQPNPLARFVRPLTDAELARLIGFDAGDKRRRHDARKAFERLDADGVLDLRRDGSGVRLFGPDGNPLTGE